MPSELLGVLIGGLIASVLPTASMVLEYRKWKKEKMIEHLRLERARLEQIFREASENIRTGMAEGRYSIEMIANLRHLCPKSVFEAFDAMMHDKHEAPEIYRDHFLRISQVMRAELADIDRRIEAVIR